jgi:hypothetical protein
MEITNLMGQTQTEEQKKKEREKAAELIQSFSTNAGLTELARNNFKELMLNPAKEAEKALIGAASYAHLLKYAPPTKEGHEQEERIRSFNESMQSVREQQERIAREREAHRQMLIDVNVKAARIIEAEKLAQQDKQQVNVDAGKGSNAGTEPKSKLQKQQAAILKAIEAKRFKPMAIPDNEKGTIKLICESENKDELFNAETAFDAAWKKGIGKLWQMEHHESYARRGNN